MSKKSLKSLLFLAAAVSFVAGVIYFINRKKKYNVVDNTKNDLEEDEEALDAFDALDLSSLKFSRHYVDLR